MKVYLNTLCPCGSGKKYKECCMWKRVKRVGKIGALPVEYADPNASFYVNSRGAVVFKDESRQPVLDIPEGSLIKTVLSVGVSSTQKPIATIQEDEGAICYILPDWYLEWCYVCTGIAMSGVNFFPSEVEFSRCGNKYAADIL